MSDAGSALALAVKAALGGVAGLSSVQEAGPLRASPPYATVEPGPESDWGHKSGSGREVRFTIAIRDQGEASARIRTLESAGEAAIVAMPAELQGWRVVSLMLLRSRIVREREGWVAAADWRARMLAEP